MISRKGLEEFFELPQPKEKPYKVFYPTIKTGYVVPWGYEEDPEDPDILLPNQEQLQCMEKAKEFLKIYSYREVAYWLSEETGRYISPRGLQKRVKNESRYKSLAKIEDYLAKRYKEKLEKAQKLRHRIGGEAISRTVYPEKRD